MASTNSVSVNSPLLNLLEGAVQRAESGQGLPVIRALVNSPAVAVIVAATPTQIDDLVLTFAKAFLPPAAPPSPPAA